MSTKVVRLVTHLGGAKKGSFGLHYRAEMASCHSSQYSRAFRNKKSQVGSLCNEEHPVCSYMFSKEVTVKNEALQVLLYTLHYSWAEPNDQSPFPEENVWVILSGKMKVCRHPHTCHKGEGLFFSWNGTCLIISLTLPNFKKKHYNCPLLRIWLDEMHTSTSFKKFSTVCFLFS